MRQRIAGWYERARADEPFWRRVVLAVGVGIVLWQGARLCFQPRGDFNLHWELGRRLVAGEFIYHNGADMPYPPFWAVVHAPLSVVPMHPAQLLVYPLFVVSLVVLIGVLNRLTERRFPLSSVAVFWTAVVAIALSSRFLVRDTTECGVNLALVALSWLAAYLWARRRERLGGLCLGLAMAMKCTPGLFLAWFAWKRQWRMVAWTAAAAIAFTLSPLLLMGPSHYGRAIGYWTTIAWRGISQPDPSMGVLGEEPLQNDSLRPALARFLMTLPEDHKGRFHHPLYVDFLDLPPVAAGVVIKIAMLALLAAVAWTFGSRVERRDDPALLWEWAAVSVLILLYSPVTWGQHCVGVLPAFYLAARTVLARGVVPVWMPWFVGAYALAVLGLNRGFVGQDVSRLIDSYHVHTWCLLGLVGMTIACRRSRLIAAAQSESPEPALQNGLSAYSISSMTAPSSDW